MIGIGSVKGLYIGGIFFGSGVEYVLILSSPDPVRNILIIMEVSDDNRLATNSGWGFNVTFVCIGYGNTFAVDVGGFLGKVGRFGSLCFD